MEILNADLLEQVVFPLPLIQRSETSTEFDLFQLLQSSALPCTLCGTPHTADSIEVESCTTIQSNHHTEQLSAGKVLEPEKKQLISWTGN